MTGETGDEGGDESCVGARVNRVFFTAVGGGVLREKLDFGERSPFSEE